MKSEGFEYFAFISYNHKDQELAQKLKKRLQSYHLPSRLKKSNPGLPKKLRPVFLDESSLVNTDESLQATLRKNLDSSNYLVVICSPNSAQSEYVNDEVKYFMGLGRIGHIIPLIIEGVPHSGDEATECFPPAIRDLPREQELLGVDLTKFGECDAFLRVIATMLGLNLDKFVADEERERRRRAVMFSTAAAVLLMMVAGVVWYGVYHADKRRNEGEAQHVRGRTYYKVQDYAQAMEWFERAANNGNSYAQYTIGYMYHNGQGVEQDYAKAREWYEKAAENGSTDAQINLGYMYYQGVGVEQDYAKAREWYEKAADKGNAKAQYNLGYMYEHAHGVKQDYSKARELYEKAAAKGNTKARDAIDRVMQHTEGQIPSEWVSNFTQNPFDELKRIRLRPNEKAGGLEVQWIQNDSLLKRLGVQRGDVIKSINAIPFTKMDDIISSINSSIISLKSSERFDIELVRGGENITLRYAIKQ